MSITIDAIYEAGILKPLTLLKGLVDHSTVRLTIEPTSNRKPQVRRSANGSVDCSRENEWLKQHQDDYRGQWVVLDGDRLIGHDADPANAAIIVEKARAEGVQSPFVHFINQNSEQIWMGCL